MSGIDAPPPTGPPVQPEVEWRRLDPRMLLVHPVNELIRFFPVLIGVVVLGSNGGGDDWRLIGIGFPVALGVLRFLTTRFRITTTQVELSRGLLNRQVLTARLDRVRAVEVTSSPIHRLLGLAKVVIGTGSGAKDGDDTFALDGLPLAEARGLRGSLLHHAREESAPPGAELAPEAPDDVLLRLDTRWVRYAPLTASGSVLAAATLGILGQILNDAHVDVSSIGVVRRLVDVSPLTVVAVAVVLFLVVGAAFGILGYLVGFWGFTLSRDPAGRTYHVRRGLFTTRETSLEVERVRGLHVGEPLGLRLAGAARLAAVVTGVSKKEAGTALVVPPAPRGVVESTGSQLLGESDPLHLPLLHHGPRARRRRRNRAVGLTAMVPVVLLVLAWTTDVSWWIGVVALVLLPLAWVVAEDRYQRLGHALTDGYLVVRQGTFRGRRDALQRTGIIGWNLQQTWFQRRAGLATLVATTAAGRQAYVALDLPLHQAVALADEAVPGLLEPFLAR